MDIFVISGIICFATAIFCAIYNILNCINATVRFCIEESIMEYSLYNKCDRSNDSVSSYRLKPYLSTIWYAWINPKYCMCNIDDWEKIEPFFERNYKKKYHNKKK